MRIAVLGLYNSGSTAVAGALHHLGVDMGAPYYFTTFEAADVAAQLRLWWKEPPTIAAPFSPGTFMARDAGALLRLLCNRPELAESAPRAERVRALKRWVEAREAAGSRQVGLKHPLLCLSAGDLDEAWGPAVRYVWCYRDLDDSIRGLSRRKWFRRPAAMQKMLWRAIDGFLATREHVRVPFRDLLSDPRRAIAAMATNLGLTAGTDRIDAAARTIQTRPAGGD